MCAGVELDGRFASLCAAAQDDAARDFPTFSLALAGLPDPHWSAVTPAAPLRRWRLIECDNQPGASLVTSRLRIDERVLHFLTGIQYLDERLAGFARAGRRRSARLVAAIGGPRDCGDLEAHRRAASVNPAVRGRRGHAAVHCGSRCSALPWPLRARRRARSGSASASSMHFCGYGNGR